MYGLQNGFTSTARPYACADHRVCPTAVRHTNADVLLPSPVGGAVRSDAGVTRISSKGNRASKRWPNTRVTAFATRPLTIISPVCVRPSKPQNDIVRYRRSAAATGHDGCHVLRASTSAGTATTVD